MLHEVHVWELVRDEYCYIKTWRLVDANPAALKSWGLALPEIVGKITDEIFPNSNATELFLPVIKKIFAEDTAHTWDNCFPDTNQFLDQIGQSSQIVLDIPLEFSHFRLPIISENVAW